MPGVNDVEEEEAYVPGVNDGDRGGGGLGERDSVGEQRSNRVSSRDGGDSRQFGWGRYSPNLMSANGAPTLRVTPSVKNLRLYNRALRTSEAVAAFRQGL